jgi:hypothetical protein
MMHMANNMRPHFPKQASPKSEKVFIFCPYLFFALVYTYIVYVFKMPLSSIMTVASTNPVYRYPLAEARIPSPMKLLTILAVVR